VTLSRVGGSDHLYVYAPQNKTQNVVYQEVFDLSHIRIEQLRKESFVNIIIIIFCFIYNSATITI
jgi:hypothetical protein